MIGGGAGTAPATISVDSTTTHALFATAGAPAFRAVAAGDLPQSGTGSKTQSTNMSATTSSGDLATVDGNANTVDSGISSTVPSFKRVAVGQASVLITSDFPLSSTWGSTASVAITNSTSRDQAFTITITAQGTGIGANPTATLTFHDGAWTNVPVYLCKKEGGTGSIASIIEQPATTTTLPITLVGTPTSGNTFIISCIGMGT